MIEVLGVLVVIAMLVAVLVPVVFGAIHNASISQTASSINSVKTACAGHFAQYGSFATDGSVNPPAAISLDGTDTRAAQFDKVLLVESLLDHGFTPKMGDGILGPSNTRIQIVNGLAPSTQPTQDNSAYDLDGSGANQASGMVVVEAVITGVPLDDAKALNAILDGVSLGQDSTGNDFRGRVKYASPAGAGAGSPGGNGNGNGGANTGNRNGVGLGGGAGNGGHNNGNGNGGNDSGNGNGNGNSGGTGQGSGNTGSASSSSPSTVTVHVYLTHR